MSPTEQKPPILWVQTLMFSITLLLAVTVVPWYGFTEGFHWSAWLGFVLVAGANG